MTDVVGKIEFGDGGPAFPIERYPAPWGGTTLAGGITARDWFASQQRVPDDYSIPYGEALINERHPQSTSFDDEREWMRACITWWAKVQAAYAYVHADAMLAQRGKVAL